MICFILATILFKPPQRFLLNEETFSDQMSCEEHLTIPGIRAAIGTLYVLPGNLDTLRLQCVCKSAEELGAYLKEDCKECIILRLKDE